MIGREDDAIVARQNKDLIPDLRGVFVCLKVFEGVEWLQREPAL